MAATEELRVVIKTVADTSGAKQAGDAIQELSRKARGGAADVAADLQQQQIRAAGGLEAFLRQQQQQQQQVARAAAGSGAAGAGSTGRLVSDVTRIAGLSAGLYTVHALLQGITGYLADSIQLLRQQQSAYGAWATQVHQLDDAFAKANRSGDALQITLGRLAAPTVEGALKAQAGAADLLNEKLTGLAAFIQEHTKGESLGDQFWKNFLGNVENAPGIGSTIRQVAELGKNLEQLDAERAQAQLLMEFRRGHDLTSIEETAAGLARLARVDQVLAAVRDITQAQQAQVDLQHEGVNLAAQEAQIRLSMLPAAERLAAVQRDVTEALIRARQAALPATERFEDLQYELQRDRLIVANRRGTSAADRSAARHEIRDLMRAEPGVALAALEATRGVTVAGRGAERVGLEAQLFQVSAERQLAQVTLLEQTNSLLSTIAEQRTQAIQLTINLSSDDFRQEVYNQLIQANAQAQTPPIIPQSGVRR